MSRANIGSDAPNSWPQTKRRYSIPLVREREPENSGRCSRPKNEKWREPVRVGLRYLCKPGQNQKIEQHIDKYRNEGDREHRELGKKEPPENFLVAERAEPQQFGRQVDDFQEDNKKDPPRNAKPTGETNKRRQEPVKGAPTAQGIFSLSVTGATLSTAPSDELNLNGDAQSNV